MAANAEDRNDGKEGPYSESTGAYNAEAAAGPNGSPEEERVASTVAHRPVAPQVRPGRYVPGRFHARGGMGEVWLAQDCDLGRPVALKRLRKDRNHDKDRFLAEAQINGQLEHPGIVPVYDLGLDEEEQPFYIMKFVEGRTLSHALQEYHSANPPRDPPREMQRLRLLEAFVALCRAVAYAHSRGVLHRDLKPSNVMLGPYGETLVLDWGLAKVLGHPEGTDTPSSSSSATVHLSYPGESSNTEAGVVMGAAPYMAPEVAEGKAAEADARTDVYLLGGILYEILTGKPPRQGTSKEEMIELARTVAPVPPRKLKREVPPALEAICVKALDRRKEDRYPTALALAEDVQRYLAGEPVAAYREGLGARIWRWAKRHRVALGRSAVAGMVLAGALSGFAWMRHAQHEAEEQHRQDVQKAELLQKQAELLQQEQDARLQVKEFRNQAEEMRFHALVTSPVPGQAAFHDPRQGEEAGRKALTLAQTWGPHFQQLPLRQERAQLQAELYDLLLLMAQLAARQPEKSKEALALLERARALQEQPSRGFYRLRASCYRQLHEGKKADEDHKRADDPGTPATALDHFLRGEDYRNEASEPPDDLGDRVARAESRERRAKILRQAMDEYRQALSLDPHHLGFWSNFQLGQCSLMLEQYSEALETLGACVALRPESPWGFSERALALALLKRFPEAQRDLDTALKLDAGFIPARLNRAIAYRLENQMKEAASELEAILQAPPEKQLLEAIYYRGQLYLDQGNYRKACDDFDRVAEKRSLRILYYQRARAHLCLKEDDLALADLTRYLERTGPGPFVPNATETFHQRGRLLRLLVPRLPKEAKKTALLLAVGDLEKAISMGLSSAAVFDDLGAVLENLERYEEALAAYSRGLNEKPKNVKLLLKRGLVLTQGVKPPQYDKAQTDYDQAVLFEPKNADAHAGLGYVRACQGARDEAHRHANLALLYGGGDYLVLHNTACIYGELSRAADGQTTEHQDLAIAAFQRALELWRRDKAGPNEFNLIEGEKKSLPKPLIDRAEFKQLQEGDEPSAKPQ
jgi:tetratricopeptide (TPR) repeat protein